jgi:hypothetical protein
MSPGRGAPADIGGPADQQLVPRNPGRAVDGIGQVRRVGPAHRDDRAAADGVQGTVGVRQVVMGRRPGAIRP